MVSSVRLQMVSATYLAQRVLDLKGLFGADVETQNSGRVDHEWDDGQQNHRGDEERCERVPSCPARIPDQNGRQDDAHATQRVLAIVSPARIIIN